MTTKRITSDLLRQHGACKEQLAIFEAEWSDGAKPTKANIKRAIKLGLNVSWLEYLLRAPHRAVYEAVCAPHWVAYQAACAQSRAAYKAACESHRAAYGAACAQHRTAYDAACTQALAVYKAARAQHRTAYQATCDRYWAAYTAACGAEFIRQWKRQETNKVPA